MGALATMFAELPVPSRIRLGALGGSYFSARIAAGGLSTPWDALIDQAAARYGVDPWLIRAVISAESAWSPTVCSNRPIPPGSCGLMQLNVAAHRITQAQATDPAFNIPFGTSLLADQVRRRPSVQLALAAYNAGTSRGDSDLADRIARDVNGVGTYVQTVLDYLTWFQTQAAGTALEPPPAPAEPGDELAPVDDASWAEPVTETLGGMEPWMWYALGGAGVLIVTLVVLRRRRG